MTSLSILSQASGMWHLYIFWQLHPYISIVILIIILRYVLRWFFGITKLKQSQDRYTELLEEQRLMLERQNHLLEQQESVLSKLGERYLES